MPDGPCHPLLPGLHRGSCHYSALAGISPLPIRDRRDGSTIPRARYDLVHNRVHLLLYCGNWDRESVVKCLPERVKINVFFVVKIIVCEN